MMNLKRLAALGMVSAMTLGMLTGCGGGDSKGGDTGDTGASGAGDKYVVGYCNGADSDVFMVARKDALIAKVEAEGANIDLEFADANQDSTKQLGDADTFIAKGVDLLVLVPNDAEAIVPAVEAANAANIPVVCLGIKAASGDYIYVGSENYDAGHMQGEYLATTLPENAKVLYLAGTAGMQHSTDRRQGFQDALKEAGRDDVEILADLDGNYEMAKAMQITEDWIQKYPQFDAIVAANDQMALGAVEALKGANRLEGVQVTGVDGLAEAYTAIQAGEMVQTILQDAPGQAEAAYGVMTKLMAGEDPGKEVLVPFQSVTADNVAEYAG
ncbi:sugar ABC transporter substrate-binding protein [Agathobaculum sp. NTUH-O15-33]|uniref:sugar ABC transporter substrate-binding protein n=1 Tax=Agathobaculum sp. NTUH-O15-33 TaxID=3079302 RepID=UPI0029583957|nr:sugar ABC transporter substrate-binding protein [Agathobaculum sp. NTUH-O15-33]WNX85983.1 sugar ABC transporter substrate-binding protein [Agathobaculum sp. NTUH-O15-33]